MTQNQSNGLSIFYAVLIIAFDDDGQKILKAAAERGGILAEVRWFGPDSMKRKTFLENPEVVKFMVNVDFTGTFPSIARNPVTQHFEEAYKNKYGEDPTPYAYYAYDAAWVAMLSIVAAGKYDGEAVKQILPQIAFRYIGATGHKVLNENGDAALADYGIWKVVQQADGTYTFKEVGKLYSATGQIEWYE